MIERFFLFDKIIIHFQPKLLFRSIYTIVTISITGVSLNRSCKSFAAAIEVPSFFLIFSVFNLIDTSRHTASTLSPAPEFDGNIRSRCRDLLLGLYTLR